MKSIGNVAGLGLSLALLWPHDLRADSLPEVPENGATVQAFIPKGFAEIDRGEADFNSDGLKDVALVLEQPADPDANRLLLILFKKPEGGYGLSGKWDSVVDCRNCGGVHGDPFTGLEIRRNTFVLGHFQGSGVITAQEYQYRYQDGGWYMIGMKETADSITRTLECPGVALAPEESCSGKTLDTNLLTGDQIESFHIEDGVETRTVSKMSKVKVEPIKLE